jgi:integrase
MLYKRSKKPGAHWWVKFQCRGQYIRQSSGTDRKELAEAFERELRAAIWNEEALGIEVHTWGEACTRWYREKSAKRSLKRDVQAFARFQIPDETDLADVYALVTAAEAPKVGPRELAALRSLLNACEEWKWLDRAPTIAMPPALHQDPRWIKPEQFVRLIKELPPHAEAIARFGAATGLRSSNIRNLRWDGIYGNTVYVASLSSKNKKAIGIPLPADARTLLKAQVGAHPVYVFTDHLGRAPVGSLKTCWGKAVKRAGIEGFRFHDLRHTWAAWHTLQSTPPLILKELGGWSSLAMVAKYGHINPGHLADWADNSKFKIPRTKSGTRKKGGLVSP